MAMFLCLCGMHGVLLASSSYQVDVVVEDNLSGGQDKAFVKGFHQLLENLSIPDPEPLRLTTEQLTQTILQYRYHDKDKESILTIDFDKKAVDELLTSLGMTAEKGLSFQWVTWVALSQGTSGHLLGGTPSPPTLALLENTAAAQNIALIVPEMDLEDMDGVSFDDVWLDNNTRVEKASERYQGDGVLTIALFKQEERKWHATWRLKTPRKAYQFDFKGSDLNNLFKLGFEKMKKSMETQNTVQEAKIVFLEVGGMHSGESYQQVLSFLNALAGVSHAELDGVTPDTVLYKLTVSVSKSSLMRRMGKDKLLVAEDKPQDKVLHYRLNT
jgi:hypothetical protein